MLGIALYTARGICTKHTNTNHNHATHSKARGIQLGSGVLPQYRNRPGLTTDGRLMGGAECYSDSNFAVTGDTFAGSCYTRNIQSDKLSAVNYKANTPRMFPFTYNGVIHNECMISDQYHTHSTDFSGGWGICKMNCPMKSSRLLRGEKNQKTLQSTTSGASHYKKMPGNGWCSDADGDGPFGRNGLVIRSVASTHCWGGSSAHMPKCGNRIRS